MLVGTPEALILIQIAIRRLPNQPSSIARATFQFQTLPQLADFMSEKQTDALLYRDYL